MNVNEKQRRPSASPRSKIPVKAALKTIPKTREEARGIMKAMAENEITRLM